MCGRLCCTLCANDLSLACSFRNEDQKWIQPWWTSSSFTYRPIYNAAPSCALPVLAAKYNFPEKRKPDCPELLLTAMKWGMEVTDGNSSQGYKVNHNMRIENVHKIPFYHQLIKAGQLCVLLCDGFYEWQSSANKIKQPYFVYQTENSCGPVPVEHWNDIFGWNGKHLMKVAGIFNSVATSEDDIGYSFSIFTQPSDISLNWLHHRMPVILDSMENVENWLNPNLVDPIKYLEQHTKEKLLDYRYRIKSYAVESKYINNTKTNDDRCLKQKSIRKLTTLDKWLKTGKIKL